MSRTNTVIEAAGASAFVAALNTALAALVNPIIRGVSYNVDERERRNLRQYSGFVSSDSGGGALATPFQVRVDEADSVANLQAAINAWQAANPGYFFAHTEYKFLYTGPRNARFIGITIFNTTGGASANYLPQ